MYILILKIAVVLLFGFIGGKIASKLKITRSFRLFNLWYFARTISWINRSLILEVLLLPLIKNH